MRETWSRSVVLKERATATSIPDNHPGIRFYGLTTECPLRKFECNPRRPAQRSLPRFRNSGNEAMIGQLSATVSGCLFFDQKPDFSFLRLGRRRRQFYVLTEPVWRQLSIGGEKLSQLDERPYNFNVDLDCTPASERRLPVN